MSCAILSCAMKWEMIDGKPIASCDNPDCPGLPAFEDDPYTPLAHETRRNDAISDALLRVGWSTSFPSLKAGDVVLVKDVHPDIDGLCTLEEPN